MRTLAIFMAFTQKWKTKIYFPNSLCKFLGREFMRIKSILMLSRVPKGNS